MTTLPQTVPMRMPRAPGSSQLMIPGSGGGPPMPIAVPAGGAAGGGLQLTPADAWRIVRANWWLILLLLALSAVIGFALNVYLASHYPSYRSMGYVRVLTDVELDSVAYRAPIDASRLGLDIEMMTQIKLLTSDALVSEVLQDPESPIRSTGWFQSFPDVEEAKRDLAENFSVAPVSNSRLMSVSMETRVPEHARIIVDELVSRHIRNQRQTKGVTLAERSKPLRERKQNYEDQLRDVNKQLRARTELLSREGEGTSGRGIKELELARLIDERLEIQSELGEAKSRSAALAEAVNTGRDPAEVEEAISKNIDYVGLKRQIEEMDLALNLSSQLGADHPDVVRANRRKAALEVRMVDVREEARAAAIASLTAENAARLDELQRKLADADQKTEAQKIVVVRINTLIAEHSNFRAQESDIREKLEAVTAELDKLSSVQLTMDMTNIDWTTRPRTPDLPTFPKLSTTLTMAIMVGLMLGLGIAFLREVTDNTVRSPRDIARIGQLNLLGLISHENDDPQAAGARLPVVIFDAPHSMLAEQFRQVRSRLQHAASLETTRSILVTGASPGDGKTFIACNLAAGLALNGRRILLVDANFRKPALHNVFDLDNATGFSDVLGSLDVLDTAIRETPVPNLSVLTSGAKPSNPTELLESQLLIDFIERALEEFDHVVFDGGPLPLTSEAVALAPRVDGVVTVVKAHHNSRGLLQRMRDTLRQVKAEHLGVILNAVRSQGGGYYGRNIKTYYAYQND